MSNSIKFTQNGFIFISLNDLDINSILIQIIDTGSGIKKK